jgi:molecular chaperone GrpE
VSKETEKAQSGKAHSQNGVDEAADGSQEQSEENPDQQAVQQIDLETEIAELQKELADMRDQHLRSLADMENHRKRLEREKSDYLKYGNEKIMRDILPVLDSIDNATDGSKGSGDGVLEGFLLVKQQLHSILETHGLKPITALDSDFDPNFHQAVQRVEDQDCQKDEVFEEYQKGYLLHGRLLRPSMVSVKTPGKAK